MSFLEIEHLHVSFPIKKGLFFPKLVEVVHALDDVSLSLEKGKTLGLVGESGCGKSTLSRVVMQLLRPQAGKIILEGQRLDQLSTRAMRARRLDFQMIFQDPYDSLNPRFTVFETLAEALRCRQKKLKKKELNEAVYALMEQVGLSPDQSQKYPHEFSGGQRQRIAIARALAPKPKLIIADEPVSALDVSIQAQILNLLKSLSAQLELTLLFISHDLAVVRYMSDHIAVMQKGCIVEQGDAEKVFSHPEHPYTKRLLDSIL